MNRATRSETQAHTRERLLDAADRAFAEEGFAGASLDRIAGAAGLTRGAIYSNFVDKPDLFVAVLERRLERRSAEIGDALAGAVDPDAFVAMLRDPTWTGASATDDGRRWMLLRDEFRLYALRNPAAAKRLARHERRERDNYAAASTALLKRLGVDAPIDQRLIAAIIFALDESLARQHVIDPEDVAASSFADALNLLLRAAVALAREVD